MVHQLLTKQPRVINAFIAPNDTLVSKPGQETLCPRFSFRNTASKLSELIFNTKVMNTTLKHMTENNVSQITQAKREETVGTAAY